MPAIIVREVTDTYIKAHVEGHDIEECGKDRWEVIGHLVVKMVIQQGSMPAIDAVDIIDREGERYPLSSARDFLKHVPVITDPAILDVLEQLSNGEL